MAIQQLNPDPSPWSQILGSLGSGLGQGLGTGIQQGTESSVLNQIMSQHDVNEDPMGYINALISAPGVSQQTKQNYILGANAGTSLQAAQQQAKLRDLEIEGIEADRESQFVQRGTSLFPDDKPLQSAFSTASQKYRDIKDPDIREQKTIEDLRTQTRATENIVERLNKLGGFRKKALGLEDKDLSLFSNEIEKSVKQGFDIGLIEEALKGSGINDRDLEAIMSPNFKSMKDNVSKIPKSFTKDSPEKQVKINSLIEDSINKGASLNYIFSSLLAKGYSEVDSAAFIEQAIGNKQLTLRQREQRATLENKKASSLARIFESQPFGV